MPDSQFAAAREQLQQCLQAVRPCRVVLREFGYFKHASSCTLWLKPETEPPEALVELQTALETAFPGYNDQSQIGDHGFVPHLSVGQCKAEKRCKELVAEFQANWTPIEFVLTDVCMISRDGDEAPFHVREIGTLQGVDAPQFGLTTVPVPAAVSGDELFVGNLAFEVDTAALQKLFAPFGCLSATVAKQHGRSRGFGFVTVAAGNGDNAVTALSGAALGSRCIRVVRAKQ
eukprot:TRINITY_DN2397_c0_g1_i3.p1 TRINITY_DN2397_c0_g1~~TRINITY_DN2397_c0_g1_i3.p1  ORF type:complete len:231 (-),score=66.16 TRINITY_DN2397_c0_g1_i3:10-702(-)